MKKRITWQPALFLGIFFFFSCHEYQDINKHRKTQKSTLQKASGLSKRIVVIVSADGFRADYLQHAHTPNIDSIMRVGISGELTPSFPSQTFPNHYTLATGLYPNNHGIIANHFYDEKLGEYTRKGSASKNPFFYGGEPIWNTAQKQGLSAIAFYWVGSEVNINGMRPDYWLPYGNIPFNARVDTAFQLINAKEKLSPRLAMIYVNQPDAAGHSFGADSPATYQKAEWVDTLIGHCLEKIKESPYRNNIDFILVSDHGMATFHKPDNVQLNKYINKKDFTHIITGVPTFLYLKDKNKANDILKALANVPHIKAYKKKDLPSKLHYGSNERIGDIVVIPAPGTNIYWDTQGGNGGTHGYNPACKEMKAIFAAFGPDFPMGKHIKRPIPNVNIYLLMCDLLHIKPAPNDGSASVVKTILNK